MTLRRTYEASGDNKPCVCQVLGRGISQLQAIAQPVDRNRVYDRERGGSARPLERLCLETTLRDKQQT